MIYDGKAKSLCIDFTQVEDQKALQSWSTKHNEHITSPVIWSEHNQKYVTVINTKVGCECKCLW